MTPVPEGWRFASLGEVAEPVRVAAQREHAPTLSFRGLRPNGRIDLGPESDGRYAMAQPGDVVVTKQGHVGGWVLRKVSIVPVHVERLHVASTLQVVRPGNEICPRWLHHWLAAPSTYDLVQRMVGARQSITMPTLKAIPVPLPPLDEQRRIVEILEDHLSHLDAATLTLHRALRRGSSMVASWIATSMREEAHVPLSDVVIQSRTGWDRSRRHEVAPEEPGHAYLKMHNITSDGQLDLSSSVYVTGEPAVAERFRLQEGDLLFNNRNSVELVGKVAVATSEVADWTYNNNIVRLRLKEDIDASFIAIQMNGITFRRCLRGLTSASTNVAAIYTRDLLRQRVWLPNVATQQLIVRRYYALVAATDRLSDNLTATIARGRILRRALLSAAFSGDLTVARAGPKFVEGV